MAMEYFMQELQGAAAHPEALVPSPEAQDENLPESEVVSCCLFVIVQINLLLNVELTITVIIMFRNSGNSYRKSY